ncbi:MAG: hypothetical protein ACI8ZM_000451 [Crocinitomix sp.]|jgi:hypothetical protein
MKMSSILSLIALSIFIFGCQKDQPESAFTTTKEVYKEKQSIQFENTSQNGVTYYWNFGDGESSTLKNPGHTYAQEGEYIVTLQVQGVKKTNPSEFSRTLLIVDEDSNGSEANLLFSNTVWISDSLTDLYLFCSGDVNDNSTNEYNHSMSFYDNNNNTVLMMNGNIGNLCEFEILNDTLIGFFENPYYRTWSFAFDGDRLTLMNNSVTECFGDPTSSEGPLVIKHFYKQ